MSTNLQPKTAIVIVFSEIKLGVKKVAFILFVGVVGVIVLISLQQMC